MKEEDREEFVRNVLKGDDDPRAVMAKGLLLEQLVPTLEELLKRKGKLGETRYVEDQDAYYVWSSGEWGRIIPYEPTEEEKEKLASTQRQGLPYDFTLGQSAVDRSELYLQRDDWRIYDLGSRSRRSSRG